MRKKRGEILLFIVLLLATICIGSTLTHADSTVSGRLGATYDNQTGNVTAMVAGYCEGKAVTVGPVTWAATEDQFSNLKAEDAAKIVCGKDFTLKKVTKSERNSKGLVADVVILKSHN
jgi:hypothetical protein